MRLKLFTHIASEHGLSSVTTLVVGSKAAALINPPLLLQDAHSVISFVKAKTPNPITAVFVSNHHSEHYFAADIILEAFSTAKFFAAPYVVTAINQQYDEQVVFWSKMVGPSSVTSRPTKPEPYDYSFFVLPGDLTSPILLLGPLQGSSPDHTVFWLPTERTIVTGDAVFSRSTHIAAEQIENSTHLAAWRLTLDLINSLDPVTIVTGHIEKGMQFDARKDMEHMYRYLDLFEEEVTRPAEEGSPKTNVQDLFRTFQEAFPNCRKNLDFFLGRMAEKFGDTGQSSQQDCGQSTVDGQNLELEGFVMTA